MKFEFLLQGALKCYKVWPAAYKPNKLGNQLLL